MHFAAILLIGMLIFFQADRRAEAQNAVCPPWMPFYYNGLCYVAPPRLPPAPAPRPGVQPVVTIFHLNPVQQPHDALSVIQQCFNDRICNAALGAAASSLGIPPNYVRFAGFISGIANQAPGDESSYFYLGPPDGHTICQVDIRTTSIVPFSGDRSARYEITVEPKNVKVGVWLPKQGAGKGRSWYDGTLSVVSVPDNALHSVRSCGVKSAPSPVRWVCRGGQGAHGNPPCGSMRLGNFQ